MSAPGEGADSLPGVWFSRGRPHATGDTIELALSTFAKLEVGALNNKAFANGKKKGGKGDVLIATLDEKLDLAANDIVVA
jgi:hypothetical protein